MLSHSLEADPIRFVIFFLALSLIVSVALAFGGKALSRLSGLTGTPRRTGSSGSCLPDIFCSSARFFSAITSRGRTLGSGSIAGCIVVLATLYLLFSKSGLSSAASCPFSKNGNRFLLALAGKKTAVLFLSAFSSIKE